MEFIDFHSHILPGMDDGARNVEESLRLLKDSVRQHVSEICATPHFYADEEDPGAFLTRRERAYTELVDASERAGVCIPKIHLGAEVLYFPGMSQASQLRQLVIRGSSMLLVEPPMAPWTDYMLDEIEQTGKELECIPVIAHVDRYVKLMNDKSLFRRVLSRRLLIQVNAGAFLREDTKEDALKQLASGNIHFIGSDCHNAQYRPQNIGSAVDKIIAAGLEKELKIIHICTKKSLNCIAI